MESITISKYSSVLYGLAAAAIFLWSMQWPSGNILGNENNTTSAAGFVPVASASPPTGTVSPAAGADQAGPAIDAKSSVLVEVNNGTEKVLFSENDQKALPIASLTKLMTALVVLENYDLTQKVTISQEAMAQEGAQGDLQLGQVLSVKNLLYITLIESSNRAAFALSGVMDQDQFIALMNQRAKELGLLHTHFADSSGLNANSYSTARDVATLTEYLFLHEPLFSQIVGLKSFDLYLDDGQFHHRLINTNQLLDTDGIIGGKTGYTDEAEGCFMAIQKVSDGGTYRIGVVLGSPDRFSAMKNLVALH